MNKKIDVVAQNISHHHILGTSQ